MTNAAAVKPAKRTIDLGDGVEREVKFTLNAMAELEERYGSVDKAFEEIQQKSSIAAVRFLLWLIIVPPAGQPDLTERQIGNLIDLSNLNEVMSALMDIFEESMPEIKAQLTTGEDPNSVAQNW